MEADRISGSIQASVLKTPGLHPSQRLLRLFQTILIWSCIKLSSNRRKKSTTLGSLLPLQADICIFLTKDAHVLLRSLSLEIPLTAKALLY